MPRWSSKPSRHARGYGSAWVKLRKQALERDKWLCQHCLKQGMPTPLGVKPRDHEVDHVTPKAKGGTDDLSNLQSLCPDCHHEKTARDEGWNRSATIGVDGWPV